MAGRSDIKAGSAFVALTIKNGIPAGLRAAQQQLLGFASLVGKIGAGLTAVSAAILGPLVASVKYFLDVGGKLDDMSKRTGVAASRLAELNFAAQQTGTSLEDLELAIIGMARKGIPLDQFEALADEITAIEDPSQRAARAMEVFGKSGTKLIPMLAELKALTATARADGLVPSQADIDAADRLGDAIDRAFSIFRAAVFEIGAALAPVLDPALDVAVEMAQAFTSWVRDNRELAITLGAVGVALGVAGAGMLLIAGALAALSISLGGIAAFLMFLATPAGAVVTAIASVATLFSIIGGLGLAWLLFTESGRRTVSALMAAFRPLKVYLDGILKGLVEALRGGDFARAANIAASTLKLAFLATIREIEKSLIEMVERISPRIRLGRWAMRKAGELTRTPSFLDEHERGMDLEIKRLQQQLSILTKPKGGAASQAGGTGDPKDYAHLLRKPEGVASSSFSAGGALALGFGGGSSGQPVAVRTLDAIREGNRQRAQLLQREREKEFRAAHPGIKFKA